MKLKNLSKIYVYKSTSVNIQGEINISWNFSFETYVNIQQDFNELDRNISGNIDYESLKMRSDRLLPIANGDGISLEKTDIPQYIVKNQPRIGSVTTYTCTTYHGE